MTEQFDIVIAGAGHNSLITAAYLGKAGYSCLVLEARHVIGGNTMTEELTLPGFLHDTCSTPHAYSWPLSDQGYHPSRWFGHRRPRPQRRNGAAQGPRPGL